MPDDDFGRLVSEIEQSQLFRHLYREERLIHYQRLPGTDISPGFYQLKEEVAADKGSPDIESLLLDREHITGQIQRLGREKFKRYFLFPESGMTLEEIATGCELEVAEVQEINSLIDQFSIMSEFYHPSRVTTAGIRYSKVASVEKDEEGFVIGYYSPSFARGRYSIDYERFEQLTAAGVLTEFEAKEARQLFKKLELINSRKDSLTKILQGIIGKQTLYLESGDVKSLLPFSQKELAERIGLAASSVSRAIRGKSIEVPRGAEIPLKQFFPRPKRFKEELVRQLIYTDNGLTSDEVIRLKLREKFGVAISRRSVANLRKGLKLPAAKRKRAGSEDTI
jgi:RNA polymerase sigma-54 factor